MHDQKSTPTYPSIYLNMILYPLLGMVMPSWFDPTLKTHLPYPPPVRITPERPPCSISVVVSSTRSFSPTFITHLEISIQGRESHNTSTVFPVSFRLDDKLPRTKPSLSIYFLRRILLHHYCFFNQSIPRRFFSDRNICCVCCFLLLLRTKQHNTTCNI